MKWNIFYFESSRGEKFVKKFIDKQNSVIKAKYLGMINMLEIYGPNLGGKFTKKVINNIYELRLTGKEQIRIFYCVYKQQIILLHAFKKKTQKTPTQEIKIAINRFEEL